MGEVSREKRPHGTPPKGGQVIPRRRPPRVGQTGAPRCHTRSTASPYLARHISIVLNRPLSWAIAGARRQGRRLMTPSEARRSLGWFVGLSILLASQSSGTKVTILVFAAALVIALRGSGGRIRRAPHAGRWRRPYRQAHHLGGALGLAGAAYQAHGHRSIWALAEGLLLGLLFAALWGAQMAEAASLAWVGADAGWLSAETLPGT